VVTGGRGLIIRRSHGRTTRKLVCVLPTLGNEWSTATTKGPCKKENTMASVILWVIAAILVIVGIVQLFQGQIILGIVLIVAGCLVGPGGYSLFHSRA